MSFAKTPFCDELAAAIKGSPGDAKRALDEAGALCSMHLARAAMR
jgi:hypothetical protein